MRTLNGYWERLGGEGRSTKSTSAFTPSIVILVAGFAYDCGIQTFAGPLSEMYQLC